MGSSAIILHPITEVRDRINCSNGQQANFVDRSSILSPGQIKHLNIELEGKLQRDIKIQVNYD